MATAVTLYENEGGRLTSPSSFGQDFLSNFPEIMMRRKHLMEQRLPSPEDLFSWTVNGFYEPFSHSLQCVIDITNELSRLI